MTARTGMSKCLILRTGITHQPSHSPDDPFSDRTLNSPLTLSYDLSYAWGFFFFLSFNAARTGNPRMMWEAWRALEAMQIPILTSHSQSTWCNRVIL